MVSRLTRVLVLVLSVSALVIAEAEVAPARKTLPLPGETFQVDGSAAFLIPSEAALTARRKPWVWYAPTLPGLPAAEERWMFERFLAAGIGIAGIDVGESYGSPAGRRLFTALHKQMVGRGYSPKPVLLGRSRGGLMTLSWAAENPDKVGGFAGIYPVCNVASYPGVANAAGAYGMTAAELQSHLSEHNPIDRLAPLAKAKVPLFAIHGDVDTVVPLEANSGLVKERYLALGGSMELMVPKGQGHNYWPGFFQCEELVAFVKAHAGPVLRVTSPLEYQVTQRETKRKGRLRISGSLLNPPGEPFRVESRLITAGKPREWRKLAEGPRQGTFDAALAAPSGGWHRLELRALSGKGVVAEAVVEHVGVGEVFVVAGQSNSANFGAERQSTRTGLVAAFDGKRWAPANDPQPGADGSGGSFMPPFGDAIAEKFRVPVGIVACGVGATSVREWLPKGSTFPNPPTLTRFVTQLPNGGWSSKGEIYNSFTARMKKLGPRGFRAVLWHQGESDANQADSTRTLPGRLYREYLEKLIRDSRREIGWDAPWFVAQASYHTVGDEGSPDLRAAQASLWKDRVALEGPDTDALKAASRDSEGKGVHFSAVGLREHAVLWAAKVTVWLRKQ